jgi:integrase
LKGFVNYQVAKWVIPAVDLTHFKVVEEETDAIYLSEAELATICKLDLSDDTELGEIRDVLIVGCSTGLRYSDLSTLSPEHIDVGGGNINLKQRKVHKAVVVPMIDYVPEILPIGVPRRGTDAYLRPQKPRGVHALHQGR